MLLMVSLLPSLVVFFDIPESLFAPNQNPFLAKHA